MSEKFALVSTVDTLGPDFPSFCVMVFESEQEAIGHAVEVLCRSGEVKKQFVAEDGETKAGWCIDLQTFSTREDVLEYWQLGLESTEYFHVLPVRSVTRGIHRACYLAALEKFSPSSDGKLADASIVEVGGE